MKRTITAKGGLSLDNEAQGALNVYIAELAANGSRTNDPLEFALRTIQHDLRLLAFGKEDGWNYSYQDKVLTQQLDEYDEHDYNCSCTNCITFASDDPAFGIPPWLAHHLQHNHYPPIDLSFAESALEAITLCEAEQGNDTITMPNGIVLSAYDIVEQLHLEEMVEWHGDDDPTEWDLDDIDACDECNSSDYVAGTHSIPDQEVTS